MSDNVLALRDYNPTEVEGDLKDWNSAKKEGDLVEEEFVEHGKNAGWTLLDLTAQSKKFRDNNGAPIAVSKDGSIKLPDYAISKQPNFPATTLPPIVCEVKGKTPNQKNGMYFYDDWRWNYLVDFCHQFGFAGMLVFKHGVPIPNKMTGKIFNDYSGIDLDKFRCATLEHAKNIIEGVRPGGRDRNGKQQYCYLFDPDKFLPLKEFLSGEIIAPIRHPLMLKEGSSWRDV